MRLILVYARMRMGGLIVTCGGSKRLSERVRIMDGMVYLYLQNHFSDQRITQFEEGRDNKVIISQNLKQHACGAEY